MATLLSFTRSRVILRPLFSQTFLRPTKLPLSSLKFTNNYGLAQFTTERRRTIISKGRPSAQTATQERLQRDHQQQQTTQLSEVNQGSYGLNQGVNPVQPLGQTQIPVAPIDYTAAETIAAYEQKTAGLTAFLRKTLLTTAGLIGGSTATVAVGIQIPLLFVNPLATLIVGFVGGIASMIGVMKTQPTYVLQPETAPDGAQVMVPVAQNSQARTAMMASFSVFQGITIVPVIASVAAIDPMAIPIAGAITVSAMAGICAWAMSRPKGSLAKWGAPLMVGCFGLIGVGVVGMFFPNPMLSMAMSLGAVGLFTAFTAYDVHQAVQSFENGQPDHYGAAVSFYLDFMNLFMSILRILRMLRGDD